MFAANIIRTINWFIAFVGLAISFVLLHELYSVLTSSTDALSPHSDSIFWYNRGKNTYAGFCFTFGSLFLSAASAIIYGLLWRKARPVVLGAAGTFILVLLLSIVAVLRF